MSMNINTNLLREFVIDKIGGNKLEKYEASNLNIDEEAFLTADVDENSELDVDEILDDNDLYAKFATLYVEEQDKAEAKDKEKEKEEQMKVPGGKGSAKA